MFRVKNVPMFREFAAKTGYFFLFNFLKWTQCLSILGSKILRMFFRDFFYQIRPIFPAQTRISVF